jgi:hypothetical protein
MPAHTLPVVELNWTKVHVHLYTHVIFSYDSVQKLAHNFVQGIKRDA